MNAHRLRKAIDAALGRSQGRTLIVNGPTTRYRLSLDRAEVALDPSFFELTSSDIAAEVLERLRKYGAE
jgi:hypothetical protein